MTVGEENEEPVTQLIVDGIPVIEDHLLDLEIEPEDRADYHWDVASVPTRLASGEPVFMSAFEEELYGSLAVQDDLKVVPQWPTRGKSIDLVLTDREGRRLAVEADGGQHHETVDGQLIPEDRDRQALLEEAGWSFHRVVHRDYLTDPKGAVKGIFEALAAQPPNADLAARVWTPHLSVEDLTDTVAVIGTSARSDRPSVDTTEAAESSSLGLPELDGGGAAQGRLVEVPASDPAGQLTLEPTVSDSADAPTGEGPPDVAAAAPRAARQDEVPVSGLPAFAPIGRERADDPLHFEEVPLGEVAMRIAQLVHELGTVDEKHLPQALRDAGRLEVPAIHERSVRRFAWVAKGKHWIDLIDGEWVPDSGQPERDQRYGDWSYAAIVERARELLATTTDPFERLVAEVYDGARVPKLPMSLVGSAINRAKRG